MVLCGVGGSTIAEAKENISVAEYYEWVKYRNLRGSLSVVRRVEQAIGLLCSVVANSAGGKEGGGKFEPKDYMPHETLAKEQQAAEDGSFASFISSLS